MSEFKRFATGDPYTKISAKYLNAVSTACERIMNVNPGKGIIIGTSAAGLTIGLNSFSGGTGDAVVGTAYNNSSTKSWDAYSPVYVYGKLGFNAYGGDRTTATVGDEPALRFMEDTHLIIDDTLTSNERFMVVTAEPIGPKAVGKVFISGVCPCYVRLTTTQITAFPASGDAADVYARKLSLLRAVDVKYVAGGTSYAYGRVSFVGARLLWLAKPTNNATNSLALVQLPADVNTDNCVVVKHTTNLTCPAFGALVLTRVANYDTLFCNGTRPTAASQYNVAFNDWTEFAYNEVKRLPVDGMMLGYGQDTGSSGDTYGTVANSYYVKKSNKGFVTFGQDTNIIAGAYVQSVRPFNQRELTTWGSLYATMSLSTFSTDAWGLDKTGWSGTSRATQTCYYNTVGGAHGLSALNTPCFYRLYIKDEGEPTEERWVRNAMGQRGQVVAGVAPATWATAAYDIPAGYYLKTAGTHTGMNSQVGDYLYKWVCFFKNDGSDVRFTLQRYDVSTHTWTSVHDSGPETEGVSAEYPSYQVYLAINNFGATYPQTMPSGWAYNATTVWCTTRMLCDRATGNCLEFMVLQVDYGDGFGDSEACYIPVVVSSDRGLNPTVTELSTADIVGPNMNDLDYLYHLRRDDNTEWDANGSDQITAPLCDTVCHWNAARTSCRFHIMRYRTTYDNVTSGIHRLYFFRRVAEMTFDFTTQTASWRDVSVPEINDVPVPNPSGSTEWVNYNQGPYTVMRALLDDGTVPSGKLVMALTYRMNLYFPNGTPSRRHSLHISLDDGLTWTRIGVVHDKYSWSNYNFFQGCLHVDNNTFSMRYKVGSSLTEDRYEFDPTTETTALIVSASGLVGTTCSVEPDDTQLNNVINAVTTTLE